MTRRIPVAAPFFAGREREYVLECLDSGVISSVGPFVDRFEREFASHCGTSHAVACCNGTAALHLALLALGIGPGDEVIVPALTFVATANAVRYCGATPVFVDSDPLTWCLDPLAVEAVITARTRAVIVVHLYGHPADMDAINAVARKNGLSVVEDAAEAHGALFKGIPVGSLGDVGTFSFYGNKTITTGEGGMVVTGREDLAKRIRLYRGQGMDPERRYWFPVIGYNYRMPSIVAAIGVAQLEQIAWHVARRIEVASWYREDLAGIDGLSWQIEQSWARHACWMFTALLPRTEDPDRSLPAVMASLEREGIESRPVFPPMHLLPPYRSDRGSYPVAEDIASRGVSLPTWAGLTRDDVSFVAATLRRTLGV